MALIDVVQWTPTADIFAWCHPNRGLNNQTQLIVAEGQEAVLINEGRAFGPFGPGRHILTTSNYPFLSGLVKLAAGGASPFPAEVWFVSKATKLNNKWGTASAIHVEDPKYHIILPVRAFGQYGMTVEDTSRFLLKMIGVIPQFSAGCLADYFKGIVIMQCKDLISKYLIEKNISVLQVSAYVNEIATTVEANIARLLEEYGVRITDFTIDAITTNENDPSVKQLRNALAVKAEMDIVGFNYHQKRAFDTLETAAGNPGNGNILNAGLGMGMGLGMGGNIGSIMGEMTANLQTGGDKKCPNCAKAIGGNMLYCPYCGSNTNPAPNNRGIICDKCGKTSPAGNKFCPFCGDEFYCCPQCGADNAKNAIVCRECGKRLQALCCPSCNAVIEENDKFCGSCGYKLHKNCCRCGTTISPDVRFCPECGTKNE